MKTVIAFMVSLIGFLLVSAAVRAAPPADTDDKYRDQYTTDADACAALEGRQFAQGRIVSATFARPPYTTVWMNSDRTATVRAPFCRLEGYASPAKRSHIVFEAWLPARTLWNGRFLGVGAGGSMGAVNTLGLADGVNRGFASVATDNGHRSPSWRDDNQWALAEPERIVDFGHRAHHVATLAGKAAAETYYGRRPQFAYYFGCSQGGLKGLMEAQRYPEDYDGIVAGAPVVSWVNEMTQQAWTVRALTETPQSALSVEQMQALQDAALNRCGGANGLVNDPRQCDFDPGQLQCPRAEGGTCLTPEQITAVRSIYDGPRTSDGKQIFPGFARGGERGWEQFYGTVRADGSVGGGSWLGVYRYMVFDDPSWTLPQLDFDRDPAFAKHRVGPMLDADNADLDAFAKRGGKLIVFHGWADQQVPAESSIEYHAAVVARSSRERIDQFFRLFMVPGMAHCRPEVTAQSAPPPQGPNLVLLTEYDSGIPLAPENDALTALQQWVEERRPPTQFDVRVSNEAAGITTRSVRACAAPAQASYVGQGDPLDAKHWECRDAIDSAFAHCLAPPRGTSPCAKIAP